MSTPVLEPPLRGASSGSVQTLASRPLQLISDPSATKRVCFYKSGDLQFSGHRMVITGRTFKTFDALLDALSKKVPLPFGVRVISTPRGTHSVRGLEDVRDGGSYVCSDHKRVKPLNLDAVYRRQVPWNNTAGPVGAGRRVGRRNEGGRRAARITERIVARTPKRLVVVKNREPALKCTVVLQKRTAATFEALLDYLSQVMQFPVLKLYAADGRRVAGLPALILCSGVVVAAGNEPFRSGNYNVHTTGQMSESAWSDAAETSRLQSLAYNNKPHSSGRGSRMFSLSSERYVVDQLNTSLNGSINSHPHHPNGSLETYGNHTSIDMETCENARTQKAQQTCMLPQDDDIEKSFCVNQDGSMTVEMKVRLTIKEEEVLHWTTTLSRTSLNQRAACASKSGTANCSPDSNNAVAKDSSSDADNETKEENNATATVNVVGFSANESYTANTSGKAKSAFRRSPTPGPRHVRKNASVESIKTVTGSSVQESTIGQYSYIEKTADAEVTEEYCLVRHNSSSGNRPIPKPRKTASAGATNKGSLSSIRSSEVAEGLQIENNGMEITETVMHIYERQGCYDNLAKNKSMNMKGVRGNSAAATRGKPTSSGSGPHSSSTDSDIDFTRPSTTTNSTRIQKELLSLSSEPTSPKQTLTLSHNDSDNATHPKNPTPLETREVVRGDNSTRGSQKKKTVKPVGKKKSSLSTSNPDAKPKGSSAKTTNDSSAEKPGDPTLVKMGGSLSEGSKEKGKKTDLLQKNGSRTDKTSRKIQTYSTNREEVKGTPFRREFRINQSNVNNPRREIPRPPMKKNINTLQPKQPSLPGKKGTDRQKSLREKIIVTPKQTRVSPPVLNPSPSDVHQYVENWLQNVSLDAVPYMEETAAERSEPPAERPFQIGGGGESEAARECHATESSLLHGDAVLTSMPCLSVPACNDGPITDAVNRQSTIGVCVPMPSVRIDPADQENRLRMHKSAVAIGPVENEPSPSTFNLLRPQAQIKPVLQQLCASIQCIRRASEAEKRANLEKSSSLPDFSTQVASVFGSPSRALLAFLSVMSLRDSMTGTVTGRSYDCRSTSEAMLVMESLQKISTMDDEQAQRSSLTDLQSGTSSEFRDRWRDFQVLRQRLGSEPLSPKFSEQEFAIDVVSERGDTLDDQHLGINDLMEELDMPKDLREEISSMFQQSKSFYPGIEESTFVEKEQNQSETEEEPEQFIKEHGNEMKWSEPGIAETIDEASEKEEKENGYRSAGELNGFIKTQSQDQTDLLSDHDLEEGQTGEHKEPSDQSELGLEEHVCHSEESGDTAQKEKEDGDVEGPDDAVDGYSERLMELEDEDVEQTEMEEEIESGEREKKHKAMRDAEVKQGHDEKGEEGFDEDISEAEEDLDDQGDLGKAEKGEIEERDGVESNTVRGEDGREREDMFEEDEMDECNEEEEEAENRDEEEIKGNVEGTIDEEGLLEQSIEKKGKKAHDEEQDETEVRSEEEEEEAIEDRSEDSTGEMDGTGEHNDEGGKEEVTKEAAIEEYEEEEEFIKEKDNAEEALDKEIEVDGTRKEEESGEEDNEDDKMRQRILKSEEDENARETTDEEREGDGVQENEIESAKTYLNGSQCEDEKGNGTDTGNEFKTDDGEDEEDEEERNTVPHPVEISQELIDFVNAALRSSSLIFTYDARGNVRIEPDNAQVIQTKQIIIPKSREASQYGLKRLPSPSTSELSDYRPETSESGGHKSRASTDVVTESGEEPLENTCPEYRDTRHVTDSSSRRKCAECTNSNPSLNSEPQHVQKHRLKTWETSSPSDSATQASPEDLSYSSAANSSKAGPEAATERGELDSNGGVLIDQGRWLLKENHLIRNSPPTLMGMYGNLDSYSVDTAQENTSEDLPQHNLSQQNALAALSSSELEEMAKPLSPKCTYYNLPHGSDSDPFFEDVSVKSRKGESSSGKGRSFRVSPTVNTSKTWAKKNGSLSSFASVEFKLPDGRVHPEGEPTAITQARRPPSAAGSVLQSEDSRDTHPVRCGQYCPIL